MDIHEQRNRPTLNITTYESTTAPANKRWLASLDIAGDGRILMSFFDYEEIKVVERANAWYWGEYEKARRSLKDETLPSESYQGSDPAPKVNPWASFKEDKPVSEHGLAGKVWMLNRSTGHKTRISPNDVASYEANGYIKGGPRSK